MFLVCTCCTWSVPFTYRFCCAFFHAEPDEYFPPRRKSGEAGAGGGAALVPSLSIGSAQGSEDYEELDFGDGESMSGVSDIPSRAASSLAGALALRWPSHDLGGAALPIFCQYVCSCMRLVLTLKLTLFVRTHIPSFILHVLDAFHL